MRTTAAHGINSDKTELQLAFYHDEEILDVWEELRPLLERSAEVSYGMLTVEATQELILKHGAVVFATVRDNQFEAAIVVQKISYSTYAVARIIACAGRNLEEFMQEIDALEAWALANDCVEIEAWCRASMMRLVRRFSFHPKVMIVTRDLRRKLQ